jgi:frataxin-like iron-binding protein CyaY
MGLPIPEGSFLSNQAWTGKQRHAVLNEKAAFTIFGSSKISGNRFRLRNETWIVTGVINDGDEDRSRVYVPSSIRGGEASALALMSTGNLDEAYIKNSVKTLGIRDGNFYYINLQTLCRLLWERAGIIPLLFFAFLFLSLLRPLIGRFREAWFTFKQELSLHYPGEIFQKSRKSVLMLVLFFLGLLFFPVLALLLFLYLASVCLPWQDIPSLTSLNLDLFYPHLVRIRNFEFISRIFFVLSLFFLALFFLGFNFQFSKKKM